MSDEQNNFPGPYLATVRAIKPAQKGNDPYVVTYLDAEQVRPQGYTLRDSVTVTLAARCGLDPNNPPPVGSKLLLHSLKVRRSTKTGKVKGWRAEKAEYPQS